LLYNDKKYTEALALAKKSWPKTRNLRVLIDMGWGNYTLPALALKNESLNSDAVMYSKKAIQLIEANKAPESWQPFKSKKKRWRTFTTLSRRQAVKTKS